MKILQAAIGPVPDAYAEMMRANRRMAAVMSWDYELVTEFPAIYNSLQCDNRLRSDWYRMDRLCCEPYLLWLDWDAELVYPCDFGDDPVLFPFIDPAIYNGNNTDFFCRLLDEMGDRYTRCKQVGGIFRACRRIWKREYGDYAIKNQERVSDAGYEGWLKNISVYAHWWAPVDSVCHRRKTN